MSVPDTPEFRKALEEACNGQYREWLYGGAAIKAKDRSKIDGVMKEVQGRRREAEALRKSLALRASAMGMHMPNIPSLPDEITRESMEKYHKEMQGYSDRIRAEAERQRNEHYQEITRDLKRRSGSSGLVCPMCGENDHGNRMNGKPVCMMNAKHKGLGPLVLVKPEQVKDWKRPKKPVKAGSYTFNEPEGVTRK